MNRDADNLVDVQRLARCANRLREQWPRAERARSRKLRSSFQGSVPAKARERLEAQFCDLSGGPCKTINPDMKKTHSGMYSNSYFVSWLPLATEAVNAG